MRPTVHSCRAAHSSFIYRATVGNRGRAALASLVLVGGLVLGGCANETSKSSDTRSNMTASSEMTNASDAVDSTTSADSATTVETIAATADAAEAFLQTLSEEQREQVTYSYDDETKSTSWSNFPVTIVDRAGLNLTDLSEEQHTAALTVLEGLLSDEAYATVTGIMGGDEFLRENASDTEQIALGQYYIAFFGDPSHTSAWEVQFGGHHLGINATLSGAEDTITFAPTHLGAQPAVYADAGGNQVQPFDGIYTAAFAFYDSLTEEQRSQLYQGEAVEELVCAPGSTCDFPTGTGIAGSDLNDEQKQCLLALISKWAGMSDAETTAETLDKIESSLDETYVNWSGATAYDMTQGSGIYFQISGPDVYIEFANQQSSTGTDVAGYVTAGWGHIHTIYRDPTNDYAGSVEQQAAAQMGGGTGGRGGMAPPS
ncbi:DUF3500 domain-containing protein [Rhodococcus opacus]|uniref:DUF3500 domain-containing protein n=1 Tax=Rhodococcus opacus TaxID=37919 RepID=UPI0037CB7998